MPEEENAMVSRREIQIEEHGGVVSDVVVPLAQAGVGGAVSALIGNHLSKPKDPPPPPPPSDAE